MCNSLDINWNADEWFSKYHANNITDAFKEWWVVFYGYPQDYSEDHDEYWIRCGFAWLGWKNYEA
jgi:hypothetical protein